jgi:transposase
MKIDTPAAGFYALNGESVLSFPPNQEKERICACFEEIREQNPGSEYTRKRAHELGIYLVFLPVGSPHLNPIEPVWKSLKWESSPLIVEGAAEYRALLDAIFTKLTERLSFAGSWIENHLGGFIQKLR